jgi:4-hydroxy-tetrahydrodipicolinate synthase
MNSPKSIAGVLPVVHTPFDESDCIDERSLEREVEWAFANGADGICTGMVSEILLLTHAERIWLTQRLGELKRNRGKFIASVGAENTRQAVEYALAAEAADADAVMAIPPVSGGTSESQLREYFVALAHSVECPVIVQDASGYVGRPIPHALCCDLLDRFGLEKIQFKPEASPLGPNLSALRDATGGKAQIFEGSGGIGLVDAFRRGIVGTIPGMDLLPGIVKLWQALQAGNDDDIYRLSFPISAIVSLQLQAGLDGFLAIEKYILHAHGLIDSPRRRGPYGWSLDEETRQEIDRLLIRLDEAVSSAG